MDRLSVIDTANANSIENIQVANGAGRLTFDDALNVYVAGDAENSTIVTKVDIGNANATQNFTANTRPAGIRVTGDGTILYVTNHGPNNTGNTVSVIDTVNDLKFEGQPLCLRNL